MNRITDSGNIVHIHIVEFGKLNQTLYRDPNFPFFIIRIRCLCDMNCVSYLRLVEIVVITQCLDPFDVQHIYHLFVESLQRTGCTS